MPERAIAARELGFRWPGGVPALAAISFEVMAGEKVALLGPNGAGKSTLLRLLAGRLAPGEGELELFGERDLRRARGRVAHLPQDAALDPEMTARETLVLIAALLGLPAKAPKLAEVVALFGLGPQLDKRVAELSGGWKRRLDLALFLLEDKELLLLDEPAAGLDAAGEEILLAALEARAARGATVLLAGHDLGQLARFTRRALSFGGGRLLAEGAPEQFALASAGAAATAGPAEEVRRPGSGRGGGPGSGQGGGRRP